MKMSGYLYVLGALMIAQAMHEHHVKNNEPPKTGFVIFAAITWPAIPLFFAMAILEGKLAKELVKPESQKPQLP